MSPSLVVASSVEEAVGELTGGARAVAGGTDLVVGARQGKAPLPERLVAIHRLDGLTGMQEMDGVLRLGALVTHRELANDRAGQAAPDGARGCLRDRRLARHPSSGNGRRQPDECVAGDGERRAASVLRRGGSAALHLCDAHAR